MPFTFGLDKNKGSAVLKFKDLAVGEPFRCSPWKNIYIKTKEVTPLVEGEWWMCCNKPANSMRFYSDPDTNDFCFVYCGPEVEVLRVNINCIVSDP